MKTKMRNKKLNSAATVQVCDATTVAKSFTAGLIKIFFSLVMFICISAANAQDTHFSQWFNSPLLTNPANTGFIPDDDYRFGANYRNQWVNIMNVPYKTISVYGDVQAFREKLDNGWLGLGGVILNDVAGSGNLTSTKVYGSVAYHQMVGYSSLISAGFNMGFVNKRVNPTQLKFPDQFNKATGFFDAGIPTAAAFNATSIGYFDMHAGVNYAYFPTEKIYVNAGFSVQHLNRPKESFFAATSGFDNRLSPRYTGFISASIKLNDMVLLNPQGYYSNQANANELVAGMNAHYNLSGDGTTQLIGGLYYRLSEAIVPVVGFQWNDFKMTFNYDVTTSSLKAYNNGRGAIEFSLVKQGLFNTYNRGARQVICPRL
jgi:type IX secretion system PorP/SprF family membrane protein